MNETMYKIVFNMKPTTKLVCEVGFMVILFTLSQYYVESLFSEVVVILFYSLNVVKPR